MYKLCLIIISFAFSYTAIAQSFRANPDAAAQHFKAGDFEDAFPHYSKLYSQFPSEPRYNFYYGACLTELNRDIPAAIKCLKFAAVKNFNKQVYFYLGRAYQLNYDFQEALTQYEKFLKITSGGGELNATCEKYMIQCRTGISASSKITSLKVTNTDTCSANDLLGYYHPVSDIGKVSKNSDFFESGIDPEGIMFLTERGDGVFFTMKNQSTSDWDIYKMEKLIDGWSESIRLNNDINSGNHDLYPFLSTDGITLYFSSNRPGGLGGFDIYKATYDDQMKKFTNVINLGIPFNSPFDDYFFVCDDFSKKAWFTSNRGTSGHDVVVYSVIWDQSVVKYNVPDQNEVRNAASLQLTNPGASHANSGITPSTEESMTRQQKALFHFPVADTIEYTQYGHFRSSNALSEFKKGFKLEQKRDSLTLKMKEKRHLYAKANEDIVRNQLVSEILIMEKQTYSLDDDIESQYYKARQLEQDEINRLIKMGTYQSIREVRVEQQEHQSVSDFQIPDNLTFYNDAEFARQRRELNELYRRLFSEKNIQQLQHADSLFGWGNMKNIESSQLLEKATKMAPQPQIRIPLPFRQNAETEEELTAETMMKQARQLKLDALKLYHRSLDVKFEIFRSKFREIKENKLSPADQEQTLSYNGEAITFYKAGVELMNQSMVGIDLETFEKAGTLKRNAVDSQTKGLFYYLDMTDGKKETSQTQQATVLKLEKQPTSKPETILVDPGQKESPSQMVSSAMKKIPPTMSSSLCYKIQIGVFRNKPDLTAVEKIEKITSEVIPESGLTKYFAGNFSTYEGAVKMVPSIRQSGFEGAFVVAFLNNHPIPVSQAREHQNKD